MGEKLRLQKCEKLNSGIFWCSHRSACCSFSLFLSFLLFLSLLFLFSSSISSLAVRFQEVVFWFHSFVVVVASLCLRYCQSSLTFCLFISPVFVSFSVPLSQCRATGVKMIKLSCCFFLTFRRAHPTLSAAKWGNVPTPLTQTARFSPNASVRRTIMLPDTAQCCSKA